MPPSGERLLLTPGEFFTLAGLTRSTGYRMIHDRKVPIVEISPRRVRIPLAGLIQWIAANTTGGSTEQSEQVDTDSAPETTTHKVEPRTSWGRQGS